MEDLLASIRKAIHEDIGEMPAIVPPREISGTHGPKPGEDAAAASTEIQQLREKISRARSGEAAPPAEPAQRAASLAAALQSETPRRSWREIEPAPLPARLRGGVAETEPAPRSLPRIEQPARPAQRLETPAILSGASAQAVQTAFGRLADSVMTRAPGERSVEDLTRELLKTMLKQWLDENLPAMVERMVREEIERVARNGR
ncbi:PopZ family protein [Aestuariivirga sp.]|uniref:PopZ family protein n=1 Tax=Aestuariivirga sp. TaxID=2650926 RepID=UPI003BA8AF1F